MPHSQGTKRLALKLCVGLLVVVVAFGVAWLVARGVETIREADAKYSPIIGACISAATTLAAVTVAVLVLRFNYRSQINPIRTELYKKQSEAVSVIYEGLFRIVTSIAQHVMKGNREVPGFAAQIRKGIERHRRTRSRFDLYLPQVIIQECGNVTTTLEKVAEWYEGGGRDFSSRDYVLAFAEVAKAFFRLGNCSRDIIGTEHLTEGTIRMMGGTLQEPAATTKYVTPKKETQSV